MKDTKTYEQEAIEAIDSQIGNKKEKIAELIKDLNIEVVNSNVDLDRGCAQLTFKASGKIFTIACGLCYETDNRGNRIGHVAELIELMFSYDNRDNLAAIDFLVKNGFAEPPRLEAINAWDAFVFLFQDALIKAARAQDVL